MNPTPIPTQDTQAFIRRLYLAHFRARTTEGLLDGAILGAFVATMLLLALRAFTGPCIALTLAVLLGPIGIGATVGARRACRRAPSPASCRALADDLCHAGGLLLVADLPGAAAWPPPAPPPIGVRPRLRKRLVNALASLGCAIAMAATPADWFAAATPPATTNRSLLTQPVRDELETLREDELLPPEDLAECERQLDRIEAEANPASPADTLASIEQLENRIAALLDLTVESRRRIAPEAPNSTTTSPQCQQDFALALSNLLANAPSTDDPTENLCEREGAGMGEESASEGEEGGAGEGEPNRGRDDAPLDWTDPTSGDGVRFRDEAQPLQPQAATKPEKIGESISEEDPTRDAPAIGGGGSRIGGKATGTAVSRPVAPCHRATVKRFFQLETPTGEYR